LAIREGPVKVTQDKEAAKKAKICVGRKVTTGRKNPQDKSRRKATDQYA